MIFTIAVVYLLSLIVYLSNVMVASADQLEYSNTVNVTDTINVLDDTENVEVEYAYLSILNHYYNDFCFFTISLSWPNINLI